ncbi:hypothetical protein [Formosa algae]|uniref:Uncharacterized protein n=1 Tax=Formosa algae TaxID=225843 RepID=A0A9X0YLR1_9FLAO|nr:hypothetical protein [Formosa algae]MBP1839534.1 hypothetical protein [Formosa algae]MDQ0334838.1 hypothetical protein [Formosa algae]
MNKFLTCIILCLTFTLSSAQEWMTNLEVAERLALAQNKMLVVVWEDTYYNGVAATVNNVEKQEVFIENMFSKPVLDSLMWEHFVPVILSEDNYSSLFEKIKNKRSAKYINTFNDDSLKIMDANGNILNLSNGDYILNLSEFIYKYSIDTSFLKSEIQNYKDDNDFYSSVYLASKYMDFAYFSSNSIRPELVDLALIYLDEASDFFKEETLDNKETLNQRLELLDIQKYILLKEPKKALRKLNKIKTSEVEKANVNLRSFLYLAAYTLLQDQVNMAIWEPKVLLWDKKKMQSLMSSQYN